MSSRVVSVEDCGHPDFRWITLKRISWEDPQGRARVWESAERTTRRGAVDGVAIVAKVLRKGAPPLIPVLKQYRPPIANFCLELPAGLVDAGETAGQAAVRELREETGYTGTLSDETPICVSDPGMTNANMQYVVLEVDGDALENQDVKQQLEDGEFIEVQLVPWTGLMQHLQAEMKSSGCAVDARLLSYAWGLEHAKEAAALAVAAAAAKAGASAAAGVATPPATPAASLHISIPGSAGQQHRAVQLPSLSLRPGSAGGGGGGSGPLADSSSSPTAAPFGSPVISAMVGAAGGSEQEHAAFPEGPDLEPASASNAVPAAAVGSLRRAGAALWEHGRASGAPFAAGMAAGAVCCSLLLLLGRGRGAGGAS